LGQLGTERVVGNLLFTYEQRLVDEDLEQPDSYQRYNEIEYRKPNLLMLRRYFIHISSPESLSTHAQS
jgi:hypothetical protein